MEGDSIIFLENTHLLLKEEYLNNEHVEISVCLQGYKEIIYYVTSLYFPEIIEQSVDHVKFRQCPKETIIWLHSHPYNKCIASEQDILTLKKQKEISEDILMLIMCSTNQFNAYF